MNQSLTSCSVGHRQSGRLPAGPNDTQLLEGICRSDPGATGALYQRYGRTVYWLALRNLRNSPEAEDLTQEVFLYLYQKGKDRYDAQRGSLRNYLLLLGHSRARDRLRQRQAEHNRCERWRLQQTIYSTPTPLEAAILLEHCQSVQLALGCLSVVEREALELAYFEGHTQSEIAKHLSLPLGTVKSRMRRGLLKLRVSLYHLAP
ncbi:MAG: sigma-70 family RNA polymerase sigma factor [Gemmatimonadaceae bacterium]|nr:sigma-70 family RNA polymerase sigma factor [Gloeobacterales cyanobacterium ES-bin-141]